MRINNSYTQYRQPNFGRLKSIKFNSRMYLELYYPEEIAKLLRTIKESSAFNEFFKKYDVDLFINKGKHIQNYVDLSLTTTIQKTEGNNLTTNFVIRAEEGNNETCYNSELLKRLTRIIKNVEYSDLKCKLEDSLKKLAEKEQRDKLEQKARAELDDIVNSLLTQDSLEAPKKKTFFENLFGWLK